MNTRTAPIDDIAFFKHHPARRHRLRYATRAEIEQLEAAGNKPLTLPADCQLYVIVRSLTPNYCARRFIPYRKTAGTEISEDVADMLFDLMAWEARL